MFETALEILDSDLNDQDKTMRVLAKTHLFGGMASWADSPPYTAHMLGMRNEFEGITRQFFNARADLESKCRSCTKKDKI